MKEILKRRTDGTLVVSYVPDKLFPKPEDGIIRASFAVGKHYECTITYDLNKADQRAQFQANWEPDVPKRLSKKELEDYREGRDMIHQTVANMLGRAVICMEI